MYAAFLTRKFSHWQCSLVFFISSHSVFPAKTTATKHMPSTSHSLARRHRCRCESVNIKGQWHEATMIQEIVNKKRSWIFAMNLTHNHFFSFYYGFVEYPLILLIIRVNEWSKVAPFPVPLLLPECLLITQFKLEWIRSTIKTTWIIPQRESEKQQRQSASLEFRLYCRRWKRGFALYFRF